MSSNNNDNSGVMAISFVIAILSMMFLIFYAIGLFLAFIFTILAVMAWDKPLKMGKMTIEPEEARLFVGRGLAGAIIVPTFCAFCSLVFQIFINWDLLPHMVLGGYMLGSVGVEMMMAQDETNNAGGAESPTVTYIAPEPYAPRLSPPSGMAGRERAPANEGVKIMGQKVSGLSLSQRKREEQRRAAEEAEGFRFASWDDEEELRR